MMYFLSVVLIGTVYPIFLEVFTDEKISVGLHFSKVDDPFLNTFFYFYVFWPKIKMDQRQFKN